MKAQRIKITEPGMTTFTDNYAGVQFTNGLSDEPVVHQVALHIGSLIRVEAVDDGAQVGEGANTLKHKTTKAPVVKSLQDHTPDTVGPTAAAAAQVGTKYTKEALEKIADTDGIAGLRALGEKYGVKGRGIVELITEILKAQG